MAGALYRPGRARGLQCACCGNEADVRKTAGGRFSS
jgi:hypothetical protein